jgi:predicted nucleic acid-binding protein
MILLDTNVISALMASTRNSSVIVWLNGQPPDQIWTTSITVFEIEFGLATMADGRQRRRMIEAFTLLLNEDLGGRVAAYDRPSAEAAASLAARRKRAGRPIGMQDTQIAGIALARHATIATRNVNDFHGLHTPVINPWQTTP